MVDGAGFFQIFWRILLPLSGPIIVVTVIWQFTNVWNDFLFGASFSDFDSFPMTVALNNLVNSSTGVKEYNVHFAGAILAALPTLIVYVLSGRYFVRALSNARARGAVIIVVSDKTALLSAVDFVGRVHDGRLQVITREEYRQNMIKAAQAAQAGKPGNGAPGPASSPSTSAQGDVRQQVAMLRAAATVGGEKTLETPYLLSLRQSFLFGLSALGLFGGTLGLWAATSPLSGAVVAARQFVLDSN
eukprot:gene42004-55741_t